ncbi:GNAT family N-acetyltransferase [Sporosarcina oncorhynchi]|uniref:GNAT family N-acetyltransferase n=1 Tax=Sporosarcina oncorhynchi TaxID=3056444 RepID=A0ABZ0L6G8_9BACL|nr:GNAT family N-acetyltransferase [Sporosarcina sp. T2O-4]WOV87764.1 GNAT family N-acetyltransferase [Sporosarcina sp. T2O-4]
MTITHSIKIRDISKGDYDAIVSWSKNDTFCSANGWELNRSEDELHRWWMHCVNNESVDFIRKAIELDGKLIGYADLATIQGQSAEVGIAIGDSTLWGKGIGADALKRMMEYASEKLGITVFHAETHEANSRAQRLLAKIGFLEVSRIGTEDYVGREDQLIQYTFE